MSAVHRLALTGELTISTAGERRADLANALDAADRVGAEAIEVDLSEVTELDTAGVQLLLAAQREAAQLGRALRLGAMSRHVADVLAIAHLAADLDPRPAATAVATGGAARPDAERSTP